MKITYDPDADALAIHFEATGMYVHSEEIAPGVIVDYDADENVIAFEILNAKQRAKITDTLRVELSLLAQGHSQPQVAEISITAASETD